MQLSPGARLGPYEIVESIGAGGMGEVYRARDPRLHRVVAIKVLPAAFSSSPDRLQRFEQEARAAAAIEHPNIVAVHDVGRHTTPASSESDGVTPYIVTELLDGATLADRLHEGTLSITKAVDYARQMLSGLAAAHARGIVHRDLKPANIFVTPDGRVKILDFGLAKLTQHTPAGAGEATAVATRAGTVLGTVGYMSPEQVCGNPADQRSDLFAVGAILYEMLAGTPAFRGESEADTVARILGEDPPELPVVERRIPPALVRVVGRCLEKTPTARLETASDLAFALETASVTSDAAALGGVVHPTRRRAWWAPAAALVLVGALGVAGFTYLRAPVATPAYHSTSIPPADVGAFSAAPPLALSRDGSRLAFVATDPSGNRRLWVRRLDQPTAEPLAATDDAMGPFWSPDGRYVGFVAEGSLKKISSSGGPPIVLTDQVGVFPFSTGSWNDDDVIVFSGTGGRLYRIPADGGTAAPVTTADESVGERHVFPVFLPDGDRFLYVAQLRDGATALHVGSLRSPEQQRLLDGISNAQYAQGMLLFVRGSTLLAQRFDPDDGVLTGNATPIADQIRLSTASFSDATVRAGAFAVAESGALVYLRSAEAADSQLIWLDRSGAVVGVLGDAAAMATSSSRATVGSRR